MSLQTIKDLAAGTVGGVAQVLTAQPFDTVKVRLQVRPDIYHGTADAIKKTASEGLSAFYKGTVSPLIGVGACVSIQFGVLEGMKRSWKAAKEAAGSDGTLKLWEIGVCGATAGLANSIVSSPVEHIRIRMQLQSSAVGEGAYKGSVDCLKSIVRDYGFKGLYKGMVPTMYRELVGYGGYFIAYEWAKRALTPAGQRPEDISVSRILLAGAIAGFGMWIPAFPFDVLKSRLQADSLVPATARFSGLMHATRTTYNMEGFAGFFRGFTPCMLRAAPVNAATFLGFEMAMKLMS